MNIHSAKNFVIRQMEPEDWFQVREIYHDGIITQNATFENQVPDTWEEWEQRYLSVGRIVAVDQDILGWIMLSQVSRRLCYAGVAEVSVYVAGQVKHTGIGYALLSALITNSEQNGFWTLQAGIFPENKASLALHKKCGFREVGIREKIAKLNGKWRDMLLLERRSNNNIFSAKY